MDTYIIQSDQDMEGCQTLTRADTLYNVFVRSTVVLCVPLWGGCGRTWEVGPKKWWEVRDWPQNNWWEVRGWPKKNRWEVRGWPKKIGGR